MRQHFKISIVAACSLLFAGNSFGQDTTKTEEISYMTKYKPVLAESKRMEETPVITKEKVKKPNFTYTILPIQFQTNKTVHTLPPINHKLKFNQMVKGNYVKFGMGNLNTLLADIYLSNKKSEKYSYGFYWHHLSSKESKTIKAFGDNNMHLFGNVYTKKLNYGSSFSYNRMKTHFYGYQKDSISNEGASNLENFANHYELNSYVSSVKPNRFGFNHKSNIDFHYFDNNTLVNETHYSLNTDINKKFMLKYEGGAQLELDYTSIDNTLDTSNRLNRRTNIRFRPYLKYKFGKNTVTGAINTLFTNADKDDNFNVIIFPQVNFTHELIKDQLMAEVNLTGDYQGYTYKELYLQNPFINERSALKNEITNWKLEGGLRGKISPKANFTFNLGMKKVANLLLFIPSGDSLNRFTSLYDNANIVFIGGSLDFSVFKKTRFGMSTEFNSFKMDNEKEAFGKPGFVMDLYGQYNLGNKLIAKAGLKTMGTRNQVSTANTVETMDAFTDLHIGIEYMYKQFSLFINANNILGNEYELVRNYDAFGFNIVGGLSARF